MKKNGFNNYGRQIIDTLEKILNYGQSLGLNLKSESAKLDSIKAVIKDKNIKIALIGRFSDGKTSILAALLDQKFDNMKIGIDETSDELLEYKSDEIGEGVEIVDTPGLFGTKEKEIDGENLRLSEKTEKYLSQAHIIIYVCDAKVPIKNSHEKIIFDVLRKYNKLGVTIFVLNKMDDVCDLEDEEDFDCSTKIKKQFLIEGLKRAINLTDEEAKDIQAVCISADPSRRGLEYWLNSKEYSKLSRIGMLKDSITNLLDSVNKEELREANLISASKDLLSKVSTISEGEITPLENAFMVAQETQIVVKGDLESLRTSLSSRRRNLRDVLEQERVHYYSIVDNASIETFDEVMYKNFGKPDENGNFNVLSSKIDGIFENVIGSSKDLELKCNNKVEQLKESKSFFDDIVNKYGSRLGGIKIDNTMVITARDYVVPNIKFKPWEAVKYANKLNKGIAGIELIIEAWGAWKRYKAEKELGEVKSQLKEYLNDYFSALNAFIKDDNKYYALYPAFVNFDKMLEQREQELQVCKKELAKRREYQERIQNMIKSDIVDVEFEEI